VLLLVTFSHEVSILYFGMREGFAVLINKSDQKKILINHFSAHYE